MRHRSPFLFLILGLVGLLTACSSGGGGGGVNSPSAAAPPAAASDAPSAPASAATGGEVELEVAESTHGQIIADGAGLTLYGFTPDEAGTPTCYDDCATAWPPLLADDPTAVTVATGLDASKLSTVDRTDGGKQLKYGKWLLYHFAKDAAAGDVNGQGAGDKWYVIAPSGDLVKS